MNESDDYIYISKQGDLDHLIGQITRGQLFAHKYKFSDREFVVMLIEFLGISYEEFTVNYFYFDRIRKIHITESEFGYLWISTYGLIAKGKSTTNKEVNACVNQYIVLSLLLDKAIEISVSETVYDVDRYNFGLLSELSPALFQNIIFYIEVFCKAYMSLCGVQYPHTHKLSVLFPKAKEVMFDKVHNDSLFQVIIVDKLAAFVDFVKNLPGDFKEHNVKYDDNTNDSTVIIFQPEELYNMRSTFELSRDFITDFYYNPIDTHYTKSGFYQRLLERAENEEQKEIARNLYDHLMTRP